MLELKEKRTYTAKHFRKENGVFVAKAHLGHIHHKIGGSFWTSDIRFNDKGDRYEMDKHNYQLIVSRCFGTVEYRNVYDGASHRIIYEPYAIAWHNPYTGDTQIYRHKEKVEGKLNEKQNKIYYKNAFGPGIDFEVRLRRSGFAKEIVIPKKPILQPVPPTKNHRLVALFRYTENGLKLEKGKLGDKPIMSFCEGDNSQTIIKQAYGYDSGIVPQKLPIQVNWFGRGGEKWQMKFLPLDKFSQAVYPIRFDTVTDYYSGSGDGYVVNEGSSNWSTVRDGANGTRSDYTATTFSEYVGKYSSGLYRIYRPFMPVDTSSLPAGASITAASVFLYVTGKQDNDNDANGYIAVVQASQADPTLLTTADFDAVSFVEGSNQYDITSISTNAWLEMVMNTTGLGWINTSGYTKLAWLEGHDINNDPIVLPNYKYNNISAYSSEDTSGHNPYLEVTYTAGGGGGATKPQFVGFAGL